MFQTLLVTFREGLEAFLMVAIATLYLRKMGHHALVTAVRAGLAVSVLGSVALGIVMAKAGTSSPAWEGGLALVAAVTVVWCVTHMLKVGKTIGSEINAGMSKATLSSKNAWWSVFLFTIFMVGREGVESAAMLSSLATNSEMRSLFAGGLIGLALAATISLLWNKYGRQVNLSQFFNVTAIFMMAFATMLALKAFFEFTEVNLVPFIDNLYWHDATQAYVEGDYAQIVSVMLVLAPSAWLIFDHWLNPRGGRRSQAIRISRHLKSSKYLND